MTESDLKTAAIEMLTDWIPADETARHAEVREIVGRLWTGGLDQMVGTACSLASGLNLIDGRIACNLCVAGFKKSRGLVGLIVSINDAPIVPGILAIYGDCGDSETWELGAGQIQDDLSIAKPAGAQAVPIRDVTTKQIQAIVASLIELADPPAAPKPSWWRRILGKGKPTPEPRGGVPGGV